MNVIKKLIGIFCLIECVTIIILFFTEPELQKLPAVVVIIFLFFGVIAYRLLKQSHKNVEISENQSVQEQKTDSFNSITNHHISQLERVINDSYHIMYTTNNPETLCERYKFAVIKMNELQKYSESENSDNLRKCVELLSNDNLCSLIISCYNKYMEKASSELKTEKAIQNRKNKFWKIIEEHIDHNIFSSAKKFCK